MPYRDEAKRRAAQRAYRQTPAGRAAAARSHANYVQRRKEQGPATWTPNYRPLAAAISTWRTA